MASTASAAQIAPPITGGRLAAPCDVEVLTSFEAAEPVWRTLEATATLTPYQRFDWLYGLHIAGADAGVEISIAVIRQDGAVVGLLPLGLSRSRLLTTAKFLGTGQSNADWMIVAPGFVPTQSDLLRLFAELSGKLGGIDLLSFQNQPVSWNGIANPLLQLPHTLAASNFYWSSIGGTPTPFIEHRLAPKRRGDLKRSRRRMEEAVGEVKLVRINDAETLKLVHDTFLEQRRARFDEMGVDNVFEDDFFRRFFHDSSLASFGARRPVLYAHALMGGGEIAATTWGTTSGDHYSLYINSTTASESSKFSLMHILIADLMDELLEDGFTTFDIGLGDFSYKGRWTEAQPVYNGLVALTTKGRIAAAAKSGITGIKRTIKQNPRLWEAAGQVRRVLFRLKSGR